MIAMSSGKSISGPRRISCLRSAVGVGDSGDAVVVATDDEGTDEVVVDGCEPPPPQADRTPTKAIATTTQRISSHITPTWAVRPRGRLLASALQVGAGARVDLEGVAFVDEQRDV